METRKKILNAACVAVCALAFALESTGQETEPVVPPPPDFPAGAALTAAAGYPAILAEIYFGVGVTLASGGTATGAAIVGTTVLVTITFGSILTAQSELKEYDKRMKEWRRKVEERDRWRRERGFPSVSNATSSLADWWGSSGEFAIDFAIYEWEINGEGFFIGTN